MKTYTIGMLVLAAVAFWAAFAHSDPKTLEQDKFYLTATITDETGRVYAKLAYRGSGPWDTKEACEHWVPDDNLKGALPVLFEKAAEAFGPAAEVHFSCEQPPKPDAPGEKT